MTPFGKFMRNIRVEKGLLLKDTADLLDVSSAYLSAVEHGKKGAPPSALVMKIEKTLKLTSDQCKELHSAVRDSTTAWEIPSKSTPFAFETANAFARKLPSLSEQQLIQIQGILGKEEE